MLRVLLIAVSLSLACGYYNYQVLIPNGDKVPHPCTAGVIWNGVGHYDPLGGGPRNPFGLDFAAEGHVWSSVLCQKDSDGDGKSNGEELGDPQCNFVPNENAALTAPTSHPGICEPLDDPICANQNFTCVDVTS